MRNQPPIGLVFLYLWSIMRQYKLSELFTLIPQELYTPQLGKEALCSQFNINEGYLFKECSLQSAKAVMAYAMPQQEENNNTDMLPFAVKLIGECESISHYNKVVFHYNSQKKLSHTVIATGSELKIANSFKTDSFESALYFLFLSIKQLQMNPRQCTVRVCSPITAEQEQTIAKFFNGVESNNLDNLIQL